VPFGRGLRSTFMVPRVDLPMKPRYRESEPNGSGTFRSGSNPNQEHDFRPRLSPNLSTALRIVPKIGPADLPDQVRPSDRWRLHPAH
jgi:hypothetical protein